MDVVLQRLYKAAGAGGNDGGEFTQANAIRVAGLDRIFLLPPWAFAYSSLYSVERVDSGNRIGVQARREVRPPLSSRMA